MAFNPNSNEDTREKQLREIALRPGQSQFKARLLEAYSGKCAITGCDVVHVLEAAHIQPYVNESCHHISNGLLLRADIHALFDKHLIAIDENWDVRVGGDLMKTEYGLGLAGLTLRLPANPSTQPSKEALAVHRGLLLRHRGD